MNTLKKCGILTMALTAAGAALAAPSVDDSVTVATDANNGLVTIGYQLTGEKGIVTIDVQTNALADATGAWVSVGDCHLTTLDGAVNRLVSSVGTRQTATWNPRNDGVDLSTTTNLKAVVKAWSVANPPDWLVVGLIAANDVRFYTSTNCFPYGGLRNDLYCTDKLVLRKIPAAGVTWRMGKKGATSGNALPHQVTLTFDYYMGIYPVTQGQFGNIRPDMAGSKNPSSFKTGVYASRRPMNPQDFVSFKDFRGDGSAGAVYDWPDKGHAVDPASFLGKLRDLSGVDFDLPTEAQWEFACRAGTGTQFWNGKDSLTANERKNMCWGNEDSGGNTMDRVGIRWANAWGLCDLYGFVHDRCLDWYQDDITSVDPEKGPSSGTTRTGRGAGYGNTVADTTSSFRLGVGMDGSPYRGYRVMCPVSLKW